MCKYNREGATNRRTHDSPSYTGDSHSNPLVSNLLRPSDKSMGARQGVSESQNLQRGGETFVIYSHTQLHVGDQCYIVKNEKRGEL